MLDSMRCGRTPIARVYSADRQCPILCGITSKLVLNSSDCDSLDQLFRTPCNCVLALVQEKPLRHLMCSQVLHRAQSEELSNKYSCLVLPGSPLSFPRSQLYCTLMWFEWTRGKFSRVDNYPMPTDRSENHAGRKVNSSGLPSQPCRRLVASVPVLVPWTTASEPDIHRSYDEGEWVSGEKSHAN
ncbi:hypothetical protein VTN96DRAFT_7905 [Rasamsonia emersonii]